jgi:hypothetical protein
MAASSLSSTHVTADLHLQQVKRSAKVGLEEEVQDLGPLRLWVAGQKD